MRAELEPLRRGERPPALIAAIVVATALGIANVVLYAAGVDVRGESPSAGGAIGFAAIMFLAAWGMWALRYWAVLGFQALLAIQILLLSLALLTVENVFVGLGVAVLVGALGYLFFKLIRAMARMQMPERPAR